MSYDGGVTFTGCFLPGAPFDDSLASLASIAKEKGFEFATDPAAVVDPFGKVYVSWLAGIRGGESGLLVSVFQ